MSIFPPEISANVFGYLDHYALRSCELVCKDWCGITQEDSGNLLWKHLFGQHPIWRTVDNVPPSADWKEIYRNRFLLETRWENGLASAKYLKGHTDSIYCVQFDDAKIISGSRDRTIKVWDIKTGTCLRTLGADQMRHLLPTALHDVGWHDASVLCLQFDSQIMVSGSSDDTLIIWSLPDFIPIKRLRRHQAGVLDVCFDDKYIISCSKDATICVWDRATYSLLWQLSGHGGPVNAIKLVGNQLVSASGDKLVKLWDLDTGKCLRDFVGHTRGLACVQFSEDRRYIVSGGNDHSIRVWDAETGICLRFLEGHHGLVRTLHLHKNRIISGSYDKLIKVWDLDTGLLSLEFAQWHSGWVFSSESNLTKIVTCSDRILLFDFANSSHARRLDLQVITLLWNYAMLTGE